MNQDVAIFEKLFNTYYSGLVVYASRFSKDTAVAEDIVSDVFASVWENRSVLYLENTKSYLFSAVRNRSLNYLEQLKVRDDYQEEAMRKGEATGSLTWEYYVEGELREAIDKAIDTLPPQCKRCSRKADSSTKTWTKSPANLTCRPGRWKNISRSP